MTLVARFSPCVVLAAVCLSCETQQASAPRPTLALDGSAASGNRGCQSGPGERDARRASTSVVLSCVITVPDNPIVSSDIGWVDPRTERYYIADRSNSGVDIIDAEHDKYVGRVGGMAGPLASGGGTATTNGPGPNGVLVTPNRHLWAGDGNSTARVADVNPDSPNYLSLIGSASTATAACDNATAHYCGRADELGYDPEDDVILVANNAPLSVAAGHAPVDPYATFISAAPPYAVLGHIAFAGAGGLEQPLWDPAIHRFFLTVPGKTGVTPASVAVINPTSRMVEASYPFDCLALTGASGVGTTGVALGDFQHLLVSACGKPIVLDALTGAVISVVKRVGGGDEVWYNPGDRRFYVTGVDSAATPPVQSLGVINARTGGWLQNIADVRGKNPAAFAENNHIFTVVQINAAIAAAPATDNSVCTLFDVRGRGCIAVFVHSPSGEGDDDRQE